MGRVNKGNREKEIKLLVKGLGYAQVWKALRDNFDGTFSTRGYSKDLYWKAVNNATADFIRLRFHSKTRGEITVKHQDKNTMEDRVEIDLDITNPMQGKILLHRLLGPPIGTIEKRYSVIFFDNHNNVSVYHLPKKNAVYIEIEMTSKKKLHEMHKKITKIFSSSLQRVNKSLFDLYIK